MRRGLTLTVAALLGALVLIGLGGCANLGYYWQSVSGHLDVVNRARPVTDWLADAQTPPALKARLQLALRMRSFAVRELALPDNASYQRYADLGRRAVVWNIVAAPELSLEAKTWCFPVVGCASYRGYFSEEQARSDAHALERAGWEVSVYGVPAYSTLGWGNWLGGDPLLNTFIDYPELDLARLIFHEMAHQVVYVPGDTAFNESFATAVERLGGARWLAQEASPAEALDAARRDVQRNQWRELTRTTKLQLEQVYALPATNLANTSAANTTPIDSKTAEAKKAQKLVVMAQFRAQYQQLRQSWGLSDAQLRGFDAWVANANNASFAAQAAYEDLVAPFEALFEREGRDWRRFYDAVKRLAALPDAAQRRQALTMKEPQRG